MGENSLQLSVPSTAAALQVSQVSSHSFSPSSSSMGPSLIIGSEVGFLPALEKQTSHSFSLSHHYSSVVLVEMGEWVLRRRCVLLSSQVEFS